MAPSHVEDVIRSQNACLLHCPLLHLFYMCH